MDRLHTSVRRYAWGSTTALPGLTGEAPDGTPQAELWMGAHPVAPSRVERAGCLRPLDEVIAADPAGELGDALVRRFGPRLPFLVKLLAADAPLSLQVHPDAAQAADGYAREDAEGVPLDAPHRNYRDAQHKPEMVVALGPFEGLCGFRPPRQCADLLDALGVAELAGFSAGLRAGPGERALREAFSALLAPPPGLVADVAGALAAVAGRPGPWREACAAYDRVARARPGDPGVLAALMLRYVRLAPGEALFLGAGVPHAYLRGLGLEVMAASDNVLRCGLTEKHVDVPELLRVIRFAAGEPEEPRPVPGEGGEEVYPVPVDDFRLSRLVLDGRGGARGLCGDAPQILVCTEGRVDLEGAADRVVLTPGRSVYAPAGEEVRASGRGTLFRVTVPAPAPSAAPTPVSASASAPRAHPHSGTN
ncbi:mannose-6-phosphate isomerase, class I [Streptomyces fradiae]|uniref:mannose-6-phosphate isomerase, class I n=1 Tax=Streptomyces fradiae TaxID=1906 RepID=UPI00365DE238